MRVWALKDNLDADAFSWFFGQYWENAELLKLLIRSLLTAIQDLKLLRDSFLDTTADSTTIWREKAIARYEAVVDEFLKS